MKLHINSTADYDVLSMADARKTGNCNRVQLELYHYLQDDGTKPVIIKVFTYDPKKIVFEIYGRMFNITVGTGANLY